MTTPSTRLSLDASRVWTLFFYPGEVLAPKQHLNRPPHSVVNSAFVKKSHSCEWDFLYLPQGYFFAFLFSMIIMNDVSLIAFLLFGFTILQIADPG